MSIPDNMRVIPVAMNDGEVLAWIDVSDMILCKAIYLARRTTLLVWETIPSNPDRSP